MARRHLLFRSATIALVAISTSRAFSPSRGYFNRLDAAKVSSLQPSTSSSQLYQSSSSINNNNDNNQSPNEDELINNLSAEFQELSACTSLVWNYLSKPDKDVSAQDVVLACDAVDESSKRSNSGSNNAQLFLNNQIGLRQKCHEFGRYQLLVKMLKSDYDAYVATASFLSPSRIPRMSLPNVQDVPFGVVADATSSSMNDESVTTTPAIMGDDGQPLVPDCDLQPLQYNESPLDKLLLSIFRKLVTQHTGGIQNDIPGIEGLLDQGRTFMLQPDQTPQAQHTMVKNTLGGLMTPVLPPFYRIFMSGIVPNLGTDYDGKQLGPWFYAPALTSLVTPTFFGFLVGPSYPNRRSDGQRGGLVVEKCKFLQESGCKGLCLHQCKIPAQEFFKDNLGLDLTVKPNFETQECQWSFGEAPLPVEEDPSFPRGCLVGCESRKAMAGRKSDALCM